MAAIGTEGFPAKGKFPVRVNRSTYSVYRIVAAGYSVRFTVNRTGYDRRVRETAGSAMNRVAEPLWIGEIAFW